MQTVLEVIHTTGTIAELGHAILAFSHRPEVQTYGATGQDANGNLTNSLVLVQDDAGGNGSRHLGVRFVGPMDALSSAVAGDTL